MKQPKQLIAAEIRPKKRRLRAFLFFLSISTILWLFVKLADTYSISVPINLQLTDPPHGYFVPDQQLYQVLNATVTANGYNLLFFYSSAFEKNHIQLPLNQLSLRKQNQTTFYFTSGTLRRYLSSVLNLDENNIQLTEGDVFFTLEPVGSKKVPIKARYELDFRNQYFLYGKVKLKPDSVEVSAPQSLLDTLQAVETMVVRGKDIYTSFNQEVMLQYDAARMQIDQSLVSAHFQVEQYTERTATVKISKASGLKIKLFPAITKVVFLVALKDYEAISSDRFYIEVDSAGLAAQNRFLALRLLDQPENIVVTRLEPEQVEYLLIK